MGRIDIGGFGKCRRQDRRALIFADEIGYLIPHSAFKNGNGFVFHNTQRKTQESPGKGFDMELGPCG